MGDGATGEQTPWRRPTVSAMKAVSRLFSLIVRAQMRLCSWSLVFLGIAMTGTILVQIFFRFIVYKPVPWSEEAARYLMVWMGMLGSVLALRRGRHIGVTALVERLPPALGRVVTRLVYLVMIGFLGIIVWEGFHLAVFNISQRSAAMEISMSIPYMAIPVGAAMMVVDLVANLLDGFFPTLAGVRANGGRREVGDR
jgi:C4-dicarboxylate transporter, DctQ subunit